MDTLLKQRRKALRLTQTFVADKADISIRTYQRYEAGQNTPKTHNAQLIAKVLNSTTDELFPLQPTNL